MESDMVDASSGTMKKKGPRTAVRITFMFLVMLFFAGIVLQVLLIGLGLFYENRYTEAHAGLGWMLGHMIGPISLIVGFFARLGRKLIIVNIVNLLLVVVLPVLASMRQDVPLAAGFHPLVAISVFALTGYTFAKVRQLIPKPWGSAPVPGPTQPVPVAGRPAPTFSTPR